MCYSSWGHKESDMTEQLNRTELRSSGGLVTKSCPTLVTPWIVACQIPLSMGFPRQEYWSWEPFPSPEDLPDQGIEPGLLY